MDPQFRLVIGVIGNDIHVVANRVLARGLRQSGYGVCNLGVNIMPLDFVSAAIEFEAHAVIISSINGEAEGWVTGIRKMFSAAGRNEILLYIGGNLMVGDYSKEFVNQRFRMLGFDRVYHQVSNFDLLLDDLPKDLLIAK